MPEPLKTHAQRDGVLISGFGFSGYRSIGDDLVKITPLQKINLIIGQNNSGKSNIITFMKDYLSPLKNEALGKSGGTVLAELDRHISSGTAKTRIAFPLNPVGDELENYLNQKFPKPESWEDKEARKFLEKLMTSDLMKGEDGLVWFVYEETHPGGRYQLVYSGVDSVRRILDDGHWQRLWSRLTSQTGGGLVNHWIPETLVRLPIIPEIPSIEFIPAIRKIGEPETLPDDYSGIGIIDRLAKLQHPPREELHLKQKFNDINDFCRMVLENSSAQIEIPVDKDMILVHMDNKILPLASLGTGIHEVIILASAATVLEKSILCVEEPELHLHPLLQQKLIKYLSENTSNQYVFTTHSAHLLGTPGAEIFHVRLIDSTTIVDAISTTKQKSNICDDLGYKASDLLQTNCIIWVEGPSDRIYINFWLHELDESLLEGVHYSIMFYGGRLFSHLTADDYDDVEEKLEDFISLRKLNRHACIVFDSDKSAPRKRLNTTKQRLKQEFDKGPGFAWVTKGREIENYISGDLIEECVKAIHPTAEHILNKGQWGNTLKYSKTGKKGKPEIRGANKVKVARYYVENYEPDFDSLDLGKRIIDLKRFICETNGLEI